jgi:hypothetical protein
VSSIRDVCAWGIACHELFEKKTALRLVIVGGEGVSGKGVGGKGAGGKDVGANRGSGTSTIGRARGCWDLLRDTRCTG